MNPASHKKWYKNRWAFWLYLLLLLFPMAELATRIMGYRPYANEDYSIVSSPKECLQADEQLGLSLVAGKFKTTINQQHTYKVQHSKNGLRKTLPDVTNLNDSIYLMGCSFTYGMGVNDDETFASFLQKKFQNYRFVNFGVPGYGTVQSLMQLREEIDMGKRPSMVILNFSKLHFDRNALTPSFRRNLKIGFERSNENNNELLKNARFPYIDENDMKSIEHVAWKDIYHNWRGREIFSTINYLNIRADHAAAKKIDAFKITKHLFKELNMLCSQHNIDFNVCFLDEDEKVHRLKEYCTANNIDYVSAGLTHKNKTLTNLPFDSHPNPKGHQIIANKISLWIEN